MEPHLFGIFGLLAPRALRRVFEPGTAGPCNPAQEAPPLEPEIHITLPLSVLEAMQRESLFEAVVETEGQEDVRVRLEEDARLDGFVALGDLDPG